jgi:hypothetical protein
MILSKELIEKGIDEDLIKLLHSKTKLKHREIGSAKLIKSCDNKYLVQLDLVRDTFKSSRQMVLNIDKDRIREMKLKMIFN